jgi:hypothetical protein
MPGSGRKWVARLIQVGLVMLAIVFVARWTGLWGRHGSRHRSGPRVTALGAPPDSLGPGDMRIYNSDSTLDILLVGDQLWAGLSPKTVSRVRAGLDSSSAQDSGVGGGLARLVKQSVAGAIDTHVRFPLADLKDVQYQGNRLVFDWKSGGRQSMLDEIKVNDKRASDTFRQADAERFIAAVHARQQALHAAADSSQAVDAGRAADSARAVKAAGAAAKADTGARDAPRR